MRTSEWILGEPWFSGSPLISTCSSTLSVEMEERAHQGLKDRVKDEHGEQKDQGEQVGDGGEGTWTACSPHLISSSTAAASVKVTSEKLHAASAILAEAEAEAAAAASSKSSCGSFTGDRANPPEGSYGMVLAPAAAVVARSRGFHTVTDNTWTV